ncbi:MAG: hypothetical protein ABSE40_23040 [Candidatus Sulfotelmatobacter sp.]|jgi:hypothetical protein
MSTFKTESRTIEITKLARNPAQVELLRVHLEKVIHGKVFGGSPRGQQFLRHVVEKSIEGDFDSLKERVIGVELFHRSPSYDKGDDAIVRVTASDVRKRLLQHYTEYGGRSEFRIDIPPGSYIPEITWNPPTNSVSEADPLALPKSDPAELASPAPGFAAGVKSPFPTTVILFSIPFALLLLAFSFWAGYRSQKLESPRSNLTVVPWSAILSSGRTLQIVASDPDFATEQDITGHAISLSDYANEKYIPDNSTLSPKIRSFCLKYLRGTRSAGFDLPIVADIVSLAKPSAKKVLIRTARSMRLTDFQTDDDFILLGSPLSNPWLDLFRQQLDFRFIYANDSSLQSIENVHPRGNELKVYTPQGAGFEVKPSTGVSYAVVAFVQNPNQSGHALILAGTGGEGTAAAAKLVMNVSELPNILHNCDGPPNEPPRSFEMLLRVNMMAGSPTNTDVVACHGLSSQQTPQ